MPPPAARRSPRRILVADDQDGYAALLTAALSTHPAIEVVGRAANGADAIELAIALDPDVVVMDVDMPRVDGFEATRRIRRNLPQVRVVILTGAIESGHRARAFVSGASAYLTKDCTVADLASAVLEGRIERRVGNLVLAAAV